MRKLFQPLVLVISHGGSSYYILPSFPFFFFCFFCFCWLSVYSFFLFCFWATNSALASHGPAATSSLRKYLVRVPKRRVKREGGRAHERKQGGGRAGGRSRGEVKASYTYTCLTAAQNGKLYAAMQPLVALTHST